jgi:2-polyprenyl-3-methyl-5-hydroxy-6-metoxy-1,4-benzoquinol methylase
MANEILYEACPVCAAAVKPWRVRRNRFGNFQIDRCLGCGFAFVNPRPTLEFLMDFYANLGFGSSEGPQVVPTKESVLAQEAEDPHSTLDARRLVSKMSDLLPAGAGGKGRFLDVGCGYGFFAREAGERGFEVVALDLATNKRKVCKEITGLDTLACSFEDFAGAPGSFSAILWSQILEHVSDVNQWLTKAHELLAEGGVLAIALPNFSNAFRYVRREKSPYIIPPEHLNFFSARSLGTLLAKHGFKVEAVQWVSKLPRHVLLQRLPALAQPLLPVIQGISGLAFGAMDVLHLGLMLNIYGRKVSREPRRQAALEMASPVAGR